MICLLLLIIRNYTYLGTDFASNGAWDGHIKVVGRRLISCIVLSVIGIST